MGFGFLLAGYFFAFLMSNLHPAFGFAGAYLIFAAVLKLKKYKKIFLYATLPVLLMMLVSAERSAYELSSFFGADIAFLSDAVLKSVLNYVYILAISVFHVVVLWAVAELAKGTGLEKIRVMSLRNMLFFLAYAVLYIFATLPISLPEPFGNYFRLLLSLMQIFWIILNMILFFRCFQNMHDAEKEFKREEKDKGGK